MVEILDIQLHKIDLRTRLPFRYGIAEMTELPHVFLTLRGRFGDSEASGVAADHLPPRWFTKDPEQPISDEIEQMLRVIKRAANSALGARAECVFDWWRDAYDAQMEWAREQAVAPLLAHFGVTLVERALIDASARAAGATFHHHLLSGHLGFDPAAVHTELEGFPIETALPAYPSSSITVRHTVGLSDPIEESDISDSERLNDGLPQSLAESIRQYGLVHFKLKLSGDDAQDEDRLQRVMRCLQDNCRPGFAFSLDGNENYQSIEAFGDAWKRLSRLELIKTNLRRLLFIEQPVHREQALGPAAASISEHVPDVPVIIDESDAELGSLPEALQLGYSGTSHKNCKGVFKGLAHKCLLASRSFTSDLERPLMLSGEDLSNIGPVALLQDLTVMASLGISSVERNGHHYFRGLSAFPQSVNEAAAKSHPDLYTFGSQGYASLRIRRGGLALGSLLDVVDRGATSPFSPDFAQPVSLDSH